MTEVDAPAPVASPPKEGVVPATEKKYCASSEPRIELHADLAAALLKLGELMKMPVWIMIQRSGEHSLDTIGPQIVEALLKSLSKMPNEPVAVVIDSGGGSAKDAYRFARILHEHSGSFVTVVPRVAKSAATLLCMGSAQIHLSRYAELGPIDVQLVDLEREEWLSALDECHAIRRLQEVAMQTLDNAMVTVMHRTGKKVAGLLPHVITFAAAFMRPLLEKIDPVHYTQVYRALEVGEAYATRLLSKHHGQETAEIVARHFVEHYPDHDFVIDREEADGSGLQLAKVTPELEQILGEIRDKSKGMAILGLLEEMKAMS